MSSGSTVSNSAALTGFADLKRISGNIAREKVPGSSTQAGVFTDELYGVKQKKYWDFATEMPITPTDDKMEVVVQSAGYDTFFMPLEGGKFVRTAKYKIDNGYLSRLEGDKLLVAQPNSSSTLTTLKINTNATYSEATSQIDMGINLPNVGVGTPQATVPIFMDVFDSKGNVHQVEFRLIKAVDNPTQWNLTIACPDATLVAKDTAAGGAFNAYPITFDNQGYPNQFNGGNFPSNLFLRWGNGAADSTIALGLGTPHQNDGLTSMGTDLVVSKRTANGMALGSHAGIIFGEDCKIYQAFSNGKQTHVADMALMKFENPGTSLNIKGNAWVLEDPRDAPQVIYPGDKPRAKLLNGSAGSNVQNFQEITNLVSTNLYVVSNMHAQSQQNETEKRALDILLR